MAYCMSFLIILSAFLGHLPTTSLFKWCLLYNCVADDKISVQTDSHSHGPSVTTELLVHCCSLCIIITVYREEM